jgi:hypothetical protein
LTVRISLWDDVVKGHARRIIEGDIDPDRAVPPGWGLEDFETLNKELLGMRITSNRERRAAGLMGALAVAGTVALMAWGSAPSAAHRALAPGLGKTGAIRFTDLAGKAHSSAEIAAHRATVFVFASAQCPISNLYMPRVQTLADAYAARGVEVFLVYSDVQESAAEIAGNVKAHGMTLTAIKDNGAALADRLGATYTPQAVVVDSSGAIRYRGRIDDNAVATRVATRDLNEALDAVLTGQAVAHPTVRAFGCVIRRAHLSAVATVAGAPTYARDVAPILRAKCEGCHRPGQVAPFSLQNYKQASAWAPDIKRYTQNGQMPPWKPTCGYGQFADEQAVSLTDRQRATLARWADAGAPLGDVKQLPPTRQFVTGWELGQPDIVLQPARPYNLAADGDDVYRNFVIKTDFPEERWVQGVVVHPGNRSIVHHVIIYVDGMQMSDKLEGKDKDGQPGYTSFGGPGFLPTGALGGWVPGNSPRFLPDGVGRRLPKGARLVIQVHYHKNGRPETDQTQVALYFAKSTIDKEARDKFAINFGFRIEPNDPNCAAEAETTLADSCHVLDVTPHMHWLGHDMKVWATLPDGTEKPIIWIKDWDFNWQETYRLKTPLALPAGTKVHMLAHFDNSARNLHNPNRLHPRVTTWGESTTDEMCIAFLAVTRDDQHLAANPTAVQTTAFAAH